MKWQSFPGDVVLLTAMRMITPILNTKILHEYAEVLARPHLKISETTRERVYDLFVARGMHVDGKPLETILPDPDDTVFFEVVMEARKTQDARLVTGNMRDFPSKPFIVTPREMVETILADTMNETTRGDKESEELFAMFQSLHAGTVEDALAQAVEDKAKGRQADVPQRRPASQTGYQVPRGKK